MLKPYYQAHQTEAGCDEAGRGCLAGPVVAAAVILPADFKNELLTDSKQLSEKNRDRLRPIIEEQALAWAVGFVDHQEIDEINILNASIKAMHKALDQLAQTPDFILVDGNRFKPYQEIPHQCIIKGDATYLSIAAASVLAKTHRDEYMMQLHNAYPEYNWKSNKGYPTPAHKAVVRQNGRSPYHRKSFKINEQTKLPL